ncbi:avidin/streptavidin family protein [Kitasatospora sp. NPDC093679]|uniref:avidin/streptavidin family protein n=1 Tax=Kitasatospora sp. NPDC093679 TaxID=3154983 RepID=UPI003439A74C
MGVAVAGDWYNEFGSRLRLQADPGGLLTGTFEPGAGPVGRRELVGRFDVCPAAPSVALGWTVAWRDEHGSAASVTSWSGQYFPDDERIVASWLFTTANGPTRRGRRRSSARTHSAACRRRNPPTERAAKAAHRARTLPDSCPAPPPQARATLRVSRCGPGGPARGRGGGSSTAAPGHP